MVLVTEQTSCSPTLTYQFSIYFFYFSQMIEEDKRLAELQGRSVTLKPAQSKIEKPPSAQHDVTEKMKNEVVYCLAAQSKVCKMLTRVC